MVLLKLPIWRIIFALNSQWGSWPFFLLSHSLLLLTHFLNFHLLSAGFFFFIIYYSEHVLLYFLLLSTALFSFLSFPFPLPLSVGHLAWYSWLCWLSHTWRVGWFTTPSAQCSLFKRQTFFFLLKIPICFSALIRKCFLGDVLLIWLLTCRPAKVVVAKHRTNPSAPSVLGLDLLFGGFFYLTNASWSLNWTHLAQGVRNRRLWKCSLRNGEGTCSHIDSQSWCRITPVFALKRLEHYFPTSKDPHTATEWVCHPFVIKQGEFSLSVREDQLLEITNCL